MATITDKEFAERVSQLHEDAQNLARDCAETGWDLLDNSRAVGAYRLFIKRSDSITQATGKLAIAMMFTMDDVT